MYKGADAAKVSTKNPRTPALLEFGPENGAELNPRTTHHANEEPGLLRRAADTSITDNTNGETSSETGETDGQTSTELDEAGVQ